MRTCACASVCVCVLCDTDEESCIVTLRVDVSSRWELMGSCVWCEKSELLHQKLDTFDETIARKSYDEVDVYMYIACCYPMLPLLLFRLW